MYKKGENKMKKNILFLMLFTLLISCFLFLFSCSSSKNDNLNNDSSSTHQIVSFDNKKVSGTLISFSVDTYQNSLQLFDLVKVTDDTVWKVYDKDNNIMLNKIVNLNDGNNTFYIEVSAPDGSYSKTYTLSIFKMHYITVTYVIKEKYSAERILNEVNIKYGDYFKADYIPTLDDGYDFINWHEATLDNRVFTERNLYYDLKLYATIIPKKAILHLIVDGEEKQVIETEYWERLYIPTFEKEHYKFEKWTTDRAVIFEYHYGTTTYCHIGSYGDIYITAKYKPNTYTITYDYGEPRRNDKFFQYVEYGSFFSLHEINSQYATLNGVEYKFSGWSYKGNPFTRGKYLYDGDITVEAIWTPIEK